MYRGSAFDCRRQQRRREIKITRTTLPHISGHFGRQIVNRVGVIFQQPRPFTAWNFNRKGPTRAWTHRDDLEIEHRVDRFRFDILHAIERPRAELPGSPFRRHSSRRLIFFLTVFCISLSIELLLFVSQPFVLPTVIGLPVFQRSILSD